MDIAGRRYRQLTSLESVIEIFIAGQCYGHRWTVLLSIFIAGRIMDN